MRQEVERARSVGVFTSLLPFGAGCPPVFPFAFFCLLPFALQ
jgi:hypothetical protein